MVWREWSSERMEVLRVVRWVVRVGEREREGVGEEGSGLMGGGGGGEGSLWFGTVDFMLCWFVDDGIVS